MQEAFDYIFDFFKEHKILACIEVSANRIYVSIKQECILPFYDLAIYFENPDQDDRIVFVDNFGKTEKYRGNIMDILNKLLAKRRLTPEA